MEEGDLSPKHLSGQFHVDVGVFRVCDFVEPETGQFLFGVAGDLTEGIVDPAHFEVWPNQGHSDGARLEHSFELLDMFVP